MTSASTGRLEFTAQITPTDARPEPVRQFTFYLLTKSYADIVKEVEVGNEAPERDKFIEELKVSPELKAWLKAHEVLDLTSPGLDKLLTADDIIRTPEFLLAYQRSNSGGVTSGIPKPRYVDADKTAHPEKYEKQVQEYLVALKKFIQSRPETVSGMELEMDSVNPQNKWARIESEQRKRVQHLAPSVAQIKYLAARMDTNLDGQAALNGIAPGKYWISTLNLDANAGDTRLRWDVPIAIEAGGIARLELNNLNATEILPASGH
jgi:hypothetical protein